MCKLSEVQVGTQVVLLSSMWEHQGMGESFHVVMSPPLCVPLFLSLSEKRSVQESEITDAGGPPPKIKVHNTN